MGGSSAAADAVARAWTGLLGVSPQADVDDFFAAGGDSLKAVRLIADIRDTTGVTLPFRAVFDHSTFGALTTVLTEAWPDRSDTDSH